MNTKGLMAGMLLAILILTTTGASLDFNAAFSTVYGKVTDGGAGVNGANVSLTANGVTITTKTMTNNRGEPGFYIFELANIPKVTDTTPLTLSVTVGTKTATTTITRGETGLQKVDLVPVSAAPVLTTITVTPATASVIVGGTRTFAASTLDQLGNPIAATVIWSSSNQNVGTVDAAGVFTALAAGTAVITATDGTVSGTATVTVATPVLTTITVSPPTATVVVGNTRSFGAAALDQFGNPITAVITWNSSNTTVGMISSTGVFTANAEGITTITAASGGVSGTATVTAILPVLTSITVSPDTATVVIGNTQTFTAAPKDQVGNPIAATVTWSSSNTTVGIISAGVFTAKAEGITTITAASEGVIGIATATVVPAGAVITPQPPSSGGGGGGGGVTTDEPYENIEKAERHEKALIANAPVTYNFDVPEHGVEQIVVTGSENENDIPLRIEVLKGTAKVVTAAPSGIVYKNLNIIAGTKRIKKAVIKFRVENSWMQNNNLAGSDMKMLRWNGGKWVELETKETNKDSAYTHFEATTEGFSHFAIIGTKGETMPAALPEVTQPGITQSVTATATAVSPEVSPPINLAVVTVAILIAIAVVLYIRRR